jgi:protein-disulfide isomerase
MRRAALALLFAAVVAPLPSAVGASPRVAARAPASRDWSRTVVMTPQGGMRMGNPAARVKLVEYGSLACPHCRHFEQTGYAPLVGRYVRTGRVSYEFRNMLLNAPDIAVSLLARCGGPATFFPRVAYVYATQPQWQQKLANLSDADQAMIDAMSDQQKVVRYAQLGGMVQMAARMGMSPAQARLCLTNGTELDRLLAMAQAANDAGINRTPTFFLNGQKVGAATWEELEPLIRRAGG